MFKECLNINNEGLKALNPSATDKDLDSLKNILGFSLPKDLKECLKIHNGEYVYSDDYRSIVPIGDIKLYSLLTKSFKKKYPFKVCCPSYIYPEDYRENIERLGSFVDEIELLYFEGNTPEFLPGESEINDLKILSEKYDLTYNIHLPTDLSVTSDQSNKAIENVLEIISRTRILNPSTYTLHLPFDEGGIPDDLWYKKANKAVKRISMEVGKDKITVETLNYNPDFLSTFFINGYKMCLDIGHMIYFGYDVSDIFSKYKNYITTIHLHGVKKTDGKLKDHASLIHLNEEESKIIKNILKAFDGVVSFEVFSFKNLQSSLNWLY